MNTTTPTNTSHKTVKSKNNQSIKKPNMINKSHRETKTPDSKLLDEIQRSKSSANHHTSHSKKKEQEKQSGNIQPGEIPVKQPIINKAISVKTTTKYDNSAKSLGEFAEKIASLINTTKSNEIKKTSFQQNSQKVNKTGGLETLDPNVIENIISSGGVELDTPMAIFDYVETLEDDKEERQKFIEYFNKTMNDLKK